MPSRISTRYLTRLELKAERDEFRQQMEAFLTWLYKASLYGN
jgi:hypothetical protein